MANEDISEDMLSGFAASPLLTPFALDLETAAKLGARSDGVEIVQLVNTAKEPGLPDTIPVALRRGEDPGVIDIAHLFESWRQHPERKYGTATVQTLASLIALTNRHKTGNSAIFADMNWRKPSLLTVIDYHEDKPGGIAQFGQHRIHYPFPLSEEWKKWVEMDGKPMEQGDFAAFLEDRVAELASPTDSEVAIYERDFATKVATPAQVVELSRGLQVFVGTNVKATRILQTGEGQIAWEETHMDGDGKPLKVPGIFMLSISPFFQGDKMRIPVRLRYRPAGQKVIWFYQIYRPDQAVTDHVRAALLDAVSQTGLPAYEGTPEMAGA